MREHFPVAQRRVAGVRRWAETAVGDDLGKSDRRDGDEAAIFGGRSTDCRQCRRMSGNDLKNDFAFRRLRCGTAPRTLRPLPPWRLGAAPR